MNRQLAILLIVVLVGMPLLGDWPLRAEAAEAGDDPLNPIIIMTAVDLGNVRNALDKHYKLGADIDLSSIANWVPIGSATESFTGSFDGDHHTIRGMTIVSSGANLGLFGVATSGRLENVRLEDVDITVVSNTSVGGLVGHSESSIKGVSVSGVIRGLGYNIGGVAGVSRGGIFASEAHVSINSSSSAHTGGLVGRVKGNVESSYATGNITLTGSGGLAVGLVGYWEDSSTLANSYAVGSVTYPSGTVGGLVGGLFDDDLTISNSYAAGVLTTGSGQVGGLIGDLDYLDLDWDGTATIENSYWDSNVHATAGEIGGA